jgi:hypothetical protein
MNHSHQVFFSFFDKFQHSWYFRRFFVNVVMESRIIPRFLLSLSALDLAIESLLFRTCLFSYVHVSD